MYLVEIAYWNILTSELIVSTHVVCERLSAMQEQVRLPEFLVYFAFPEFLVHFAKNIQFSPPLPFLSSPSSLLWTVKQISFYRLGTLNLNMVNLKFYLIQSFCDIFARFPLFHI